MGPPLSSIHNGHLEVVYETGSKMCSDVMSYSPYFSQPTTRQFGRRNLQFVSCHAEHYFLVIPSLFILKFQ